MGGPSPLAQRLAEALPRARVSPAETGANRGRHLQAPKGPGFRDAHPKLLPPSETRSHPCSCRTLSLRAGEYSAACRGFRTANGP